MIRYDNYASNLEGHILDIRELKYHFASKALYMHLVTMRGYSCRSLWRYDAFTSWMITKSYVLHLRVIGTEIIPCFSVVAARCSLTDLPCGLSLTSGHQVIQYLPMQVVAL